MIFSSRNKSKDLLVKPRTYITGMNVPKLEFDFNLTYSGTTSYSIAGVIDRRYVGEMENKEMENNKYEDMFDYDAYGILAKSGISSRDPITHNNKIKLTLEDILTEGALRHPGKKITYYVNSCRVVSASQSFRPIPLVKQKSLSFETLSQGCHLKDGIDAYISNQKEENDKPKTIPPKPSGTLLAKSWANDSDSESDSDIDNDSDNNIEK